MKYLKPIIFFLIITPKLLIAQSIKVVVYDAPPMIYMDKQAVPQGIFIDVLNEIARKENWTLKYKYYELKDIIAAVDNQEVDIVPDVINKSIEGFYFGKESLSTSWGKVYFSKECKIKNIIDLENKAIVAQDGDYIVNASENGLLHLLKSFNIKAKIVYVRTYEEAFQYIKEGKADAGVVNKIFGDSNYEKYEINKSEIIFSPIISLTTPASAFPSFMY